MTSIPMVLANNLDKKKALRATGFDSTHSAVPDCFSPMISFWVRMMMPMERAKPPIPKNPMRPSVNGFSIGTSPSGVTMLGKTNSTIARKPFKTTSQRIV